MGGFSLYWSYDCLASFLWKLIPKGHRLLQQTCCGRHLKSSNMVHSFDVHQALFDGCGLQKWSCSPHPPPLVSELVTLPWWDYTEAILMKTVLHVSVTIVEWPSVQAHIPFSFSRCCLLIEQRVPHSSEGDLGKSARFTSVMWLFGQQRDLCRQRRWGVILKPRNFFKSLEDFFHSRSAILQSPKCGCAEGHSMNNNNK